MDVNREHLLRAEKYRIAYRIKPAGAQFNTPCNKITVKGSMSTNRRGILQERNKQQILAKIRALLKM